MSSSKNPGSYACYNATQKHVQLDLAFQMLHQHFVWFCGQMINRCFQEKWTNASKREATVPKLVCGDLLTLMNEDNLEHHYSYKHAKLDELHFEISTEVRKGVTGIGQQHLQTPDRNMIVNAK